MSQQLVLGVQPEDPSLVPSTHVGQLTTACNCSFRGIACLIMWVLMCIYSLTHNIQFKTILKGQ